MTSRLSPKFQLFLRFFVSAGLIYYLIRLIDWKEALNVMKGGSFLYMGAAFIAIQITVSSSVVKWYMLLHPLHQKTTGKSVSIHQLGRLYYVGLFFNNFLPGSVGGDVVRVVQLGNKTGVARATASVALERLTSGLALVLIVLVSALFMKDARPYLVTLLLLAVLALVIYMLLKYLLRNHREQGLSNSRIGKLFEKGRTALLSFLKTVSNYRHESWKWWALIGLLSLAFQVGMAWINDLLFLSFGIDVPWLDLLVIITLISVITMIPVSLNGIGVREAGYVFFFQRLGVPDEISLSVSLLFFFLVSFSSLIGGIFWFIERRGTNEALG